MSSSKYILIIGILLTIITWGGYIFFLWDLGVQKNETDSLKAEVSFYENRHMEIREMINFLESKESQIKDIESFFLIYNEQNIVNFIEKIEQLAQETRVELEISNLLPSSENDKKYLNADFALKGNWEEINKMIALVENIPYKVSITDLSLRKEGDAWTSSLKVKILTTE
jgi:Tfp pilus assembly protein PilO